MKYVFFILLSVITLSSFAQTNIDGIITQSNGLQTGIEITLSSDTTINIPHQRRCKLQNLSFETNLNIKFNLEIIYYTPQGVPMIQAIESDTSLSIDAKEYKKRIFSTHIITPKTTENSVVDAVTKKVLSGQPLPGRTYIPEILLYQQMTRTDLQSMGVTNASQENRPLQSFYKMVMIAMRQVLIRNGLLKQ